eukprot:1159185-Pelagomonas_calceolata.AAC.26
MVCNVTAYPLILLLRHLFFAPVKLPTSDVSLLFWSNTKTVLDFKLFVSTSALLSFGLVWLQASLLMLQAHENCFCNKQQSQTGSMVEKGTRHDGNNESWKEASPNACYHLTSLDIQERCTTGKVRQKIPKRGSLTEREPGPCLPPPDITQHPRLMHDRKDEAESSTRRFSYRTRPWPMPATT